MILLDVVLDTYFYKGGKRMAKLSLSLVAPQPTKDLLKFLSNFDGKHIFTAYHRDRSPTNDLYPRHFPTDIHSCYTYLRELQLQGYEIYFTVNEVAGNTRKAEDVIRARAVFVDDDNQREGGFRTDFILQPSLIVETSQGKYHYYWLTSTTDLTEWTRVQEALIHLYRTDPKIKDLSRVMRLPEFNHYTNFKTRVVGGNGRMYTWEEITNNYPAIPTELLDEGLRSGPSRSQGEMMAIIAAGKPNTGLHDATRDLAWGLLKDGKSTVATIKFLKDLMSGYDMNNARQKENFNIVERTVMSAAKKIKNDGNLPSTTIKVYPLERDWSYLLDNNIPKDAIPEVVYTAAKEVGDFTCAGEVPAILASVVITSALLGRNVLIHEIDNSLLQRPRMGLVIAMHTGTVKTRVYEHMCKPFFDYQIKLQQDWEEAKHRKREEIEMLKTRKQKLLQEYKNNKSTVASEDKYTLTELEFISKRMQWLDQGKPHLFIDDSTEERLISKMHENHGVMAVLSDDARNTMKNIMGMRYTNAGVGAEGTYIAGLTGSTIDSNRQKDGGTDISIIDPVLNLLLFIQPDMATKFKQSDVYVESGLAARIPIYYYPITGEEIINKREKRQRQPINMSNMEPYYKALYRLCKRSPHHSLVVRLSENAKKRHTQMDSEFGDLLKDRWRGHYDKTNKVSTLIVTYATVFAAIDDPVFADKLEICENRSNKIFEAESASCAAIGGDLTTSTSDEKLTFGEITYTLRTKYINMGWMFAKCIFTQSIESYDELDKHPIIQMSKQVISAIAILYAKGKIWQGFTECAAFSNMMPVTCRKDMSEILTTLVDAGWLVTTMRTQVEGKGRLNNGLPNKIVKPGDCIYHLNIQGIAEAKETYLDSEVKWSKSDIDLLKTINVKGK